MILVQNIHFKNGVRPGMAIANKEGVPGTLGCFVQLVKDQSWAALTNGHILIGKNAQPGQVYWEIKYFTDGRYTCKNAGKTIAAYIGMITLNNKPYFVDCAIGSCANKKPPNYFPGETCDINGIAKPQLGERVKKIGARTGLTFGSIVDIAYQDYAYIDGKAFEAPNQLLISPDDKTRRFSSGGDSGSIVLNARNQVIGLLWGSNANGEGIASPIAPVLLALGIKIPESKTGFFQRLGRRIVHLPTKHFTKTALYV